MRPVRGKVLIVLLMAALAAAGCRRQANRQITIGLSLDTLREERWQRDRDLFVKRSGELGARVLVQAANNDEAVQSSQAENLLTQGGDVLIAAPDHSKTAATIVESTQRGGGAALPYDGLT